MIGNRDRRIDTLGVAAWVVVAVALALIFFAARESCDERCQQGIAPDASGGPLQRIFYVHVPAAWVAYLGFAIAFLSSIAYLRTNSRRWDLVAHAGAEIGLLFCTLVLITGPIWARPVWGTWWEWDARLTSTLVLWLIFAGYLLLRSLATDRTRIGRPAAVLAIVGFLNVPLVHFSVYWWQTLHPTGPTPANPTEASGLGAPELAAFFTSLVGFTLLFAWLLALRVRVGRMEDHVEELETTRFAVA